MVQRLLIDDYMTIAELAEIKGVKVKTLKQWMKNHPQGLDCRLVGKRCKVCRLSSLESYQKREVK